MRSALAGLALVPVLAAYSCGLIGLQQRPAAVATLGPKVRVVATTTQLADFARQVGGTRVEVVGLLTSDADPHELEPTPADLHALEKANVIVENGLGLDRWLSPIVDSAAATGVRVDASTGVAARGGDPHIWFDPMEAKVMVANIASALKRVDPVSAPTYDGNQRSYDGELDALDARIAAQVDTLANRKLVTNHDAFGYFVARYHLDFVGSIIPSFDVQAEPSSRDLNRLVDRLRAEHVKAVFAESSLPAKTAETIAREAGVKVVEGRDSLYADSLGPPGSGADTYVGMMSHNTRTIVDNLR